MSARRDRKQARKRSKPVVIPAHPELTAHADAIRRLGRQAFDDVIEIGRHLIECRNLLKAQRVWLAWLKAEFGWSRRTADRFVDLFSAKDKVRNLRTLPLAALYLLARASPKTIEVIERRVEAGERLRLHDVREHISEQPQRRIQITPSERPQSERPTLTSADLREAAFRQALLDLPRRLAEFADFLADLSADDIAASIKPEARQGILADIAKIKTALAKLSEALWNMGRPREVADEDNTTKH